MKKQLLREQGKLTLKSFSRKEKKEIEQQLYNQLFQSSFYKEAKTIGVTVSLKSEWNTNPIIEKAWEDNKNVVVPKCAPQTKSMTFYELTDYSQLETVYYGLKEPSPSQTSAVEKEAINLILVPGLLFDRRGFRIGYGGGFYDRYLKDFQGHTVSLLSHRQLIEEIPYESFDQPVHQLILENEVVRTTSSIE
ncbi:5-formyltetrahydrofolate cyclo-ligase [Halobacillus andaensis]|uniref:5-formyltetrahydrofolate cyclo-ligase n=1 Tax=Halobacillus andaensis TaxID=1176239 RepID=A0A917AXT1_HALAA|nr:5-formyltetrahydrofolate cyclo-ligase [Halobacillus andaensis]MBP2003091.1 5-formyltetrahydrofolate cyclo-ligase [Halobacillus andaensis]GGF07917.1 5-formyltetrahydrofolate cyclo-ligase [Halobacillus andaensis]